MHRKRPRLFKSHYSEECILKLWHKLSQSPRWCLLWREHDRTSGTSLISCPFKLAPNQRAASTGTPLLLSVLKPGAEPSWLCAVTSCSVRGTVQSPVQAPVLGAVSRILRLRLPVLSPASHCSCMVDLIVPYPFLAAMGDHPKSKFICTIHLEASH